MDLNAGGKRARDEADGEVERRECPAASSSPSSASSSSASSSSSTPPEPRDGWLPSAHALATRASEAAALSSGALRAGCLHGAHEGARCGECGHELHVPADAAASAPPPPRERSEVAWSALGELLIDVIPCVVCAGYWREVGSNIAICRATWRDRNTWGALKKFGRYRKREMSRLHWACWKGKEARVLELLAEFRFGIEMRDKEGWTPLMMACFEGNTAVARLLLDRGAALEARSEHRLTSLFLAIQQGHLDVTRVLLDRGASVSATANDGGFPLYIGSQNGHAAVVQELLSRGADVDARMIDGRTSLYVASQKGRTAVVQELLNRGAAVDARSNNYTTPLITACTCGHIEVAKLLISRGAEINAVDNIGSALQAAVDDKHAEVEALLRAHGAV